MSFSQISLSKTKKILGDSIDLNDFPDVDDEEVIVEDGYDSTDETQTSNYSADRRFLLSQARSFRQMEHLFFALDSLEAWKGHAKQITALVRYAQGVPMMMLIP